MPRPGTGVVSASVGPDGKKKTSKRGKQVHNCRIYGCSKVYSRDEHLRRHENLKHTERPIWCGECPTSYDNMDAWRAHRTSVHPAVLVDESTNITFDAPPPPPPSPPPSSSQGGGGAPPVGSSGQAVYSYALGGNAGSYTQAYPGAYGTGGASFYQAHPQPPMYPYVYQPYSAPATGQNPYPFSP